MKESTLKKTSIIFTIIGITFLFFISENAEFELPKGDYISMNVTVAEITRNNNNSYVTIKYTETKIIPFYETELDLKEGDYIMIKGKKQNGEIYPQIIEKI